MDGKAERVAGLLAELYRLAVRCGLVFQGGEWHDGKEAKGGSKAIATRAG